MQNRQWPGRTTCLLIAAAVLLTASNLRADDESSAIDSAREEATKAAQSASEAVSKAVESAAEDAREAVKHAREAARQAAKEAAKEAASAQRKVEIIFGNTNTSPYSLNVLLAPVPKALDAQLDLKGEGLLVEHVGKEGAAAKAGVQVNDILLAANAKPLKKPADVEVVLTDGKEIAFRVLRGGKPMTISVTPTKREDTVLNLEFNTREIERTVREKLKDAGVGDFSIDFMQPGRFVPPGFHFGSELPDDLSVTIRKQGKKPADVEVKRGDQTWNIKDSDFSALPDELRQPVRSFLLGPARYRIRPRQRSSPA